MSQPSPALRISAPPVRLETEADARRAFAAPRLNVDVSVPGAGEPQIAERLAKLHGKAREKQGPSREHWEVLFDRAYHALTTEPCPETLERAFQCLKEMKEAWEPAAWDQFADVDSLRHPVRELFHQDPFTRRSFDKPRGYAGDAVMLDYIYGERPPEPDTTEVGRHIFQFTTNAPASQSVRARRDVLARALDDAADRGRSPKVLAIACGHLREASRSRALLEGRVGALTALDQDAESLDLIAAAHAGLPVRTVRASVKGILAGKVAFGGQDLVYAAGLYDYLSERVATRLTRLLFDMLAPGGRLLVANFAPSLRDIGYMETYMGWRLIYRTPDEMHRLGNEIPAREASGERLFWDEHRNIVFLELTKA